MTYGQGKNMQSLHSQLKRRPPHSSWKAASMSCQHLDFHRQQLLRLYCWRAHVVGWALWTWRVLLMCQKQFALLQCPRPGQSTPATADRSVIKRVTTSAASTLPNGRYMLSPMSSWQLPPFWTVGKAYCLQSTPSVGICHCCGFMFVTIEVSRALQASSLLTGELKSTSDHGKGANWQYMAQQCQSWPQITPTWEAHQTEDHPVPLKSGFWCNCMKLGVPRIKN